MPQKVIRFTGINRKANEFQNSGACEELINLRPELGGGHKVVKPKLEKLSVVPYTTVYEHSFGEVSNLVFVRASGRVDWMDVSSKETNELTIKFTTPNLSISSAGNVLVIYDEDNKTQSVFKFEDGDYVSYDIAFKPITDIGFTYRYGDTTKGLNTATADDSTSAAYNAALQKAASGFYSKYPNGLCGAAVVGCAYELEDGSEVWSTAFAVANVQSINNYTAPTMNTSTNQLTVSGATLVSLKLTFGEGESNNVKKVNIYATRPVFPYEVGYTGSANVINELTLDDVSLAGQPMYYQGSVIPETGVVSFTLNFDASQAGETLMEVNAGCIERIGGAVSYNNRFHYYRSEVQHIIQIPTISDKAEGRTSASYWIAYVKFDDGWKLIDYKYRFSESIPNDFIYPMAGVKQLAFVKADWSSDGDFTVPYTDMFYVNLKDSAAYNYSYAFGVTPTLEQADSFYDAMQEAGQIWGEGFDTKVFWKNEINAINVSAQYNPFVFPVEYSYAFSGEIKDIATSYLPISSTQIGQYPLTVFTSNGIFAMEQGDGSVLYSNIIPLQPHVITGKATATPYGTFFVSANSLYLLSGREVANVSYTLNGERELNLRNNEAYKRLCEYHSNSSHYLPDLLSRGDFEDFISDCSLIYDQLHNELYISSNDIDIPYSYVFNLDTKQYHKVSWQYVRPMNGNRYAIKNEDRTANLVDLSIEEHSNMPVLLQSRPMSLEMLYTHIQRLLFLVDTKLTGDQYLCISVFGGDNLYDWKCIISSQKRNTVLRQIRTNRSAKSYRDYIVFINGWVDTDTDLSDIIADYTVVNRRLG